MQSDQPSTPSATSSSDTTERSVNVNRRRSSLKSECHRCMEYLTHALHRAGSRPQALLRAMGASTNFVLEEGGRGVTVSIPTKRTLASPPIQRRLSVNSTDDSQLGGDVSPAFARGRMAHRMQSAVGNVVSSSGGQALVATSADTAPFAAARGGDSIDLQIQCQKCGTGGPEGLARAYVKGPDPLSIVLCSNRLSTQREIDEVLVHELMHVYDVRVQDMDLRQCKQLAYSEVRAAREAECHDSSRFTKGYCTKAKATVATRNMFPEDGKGCVCDVFEEAMDDLAPFGRGLKSVTATLKKNAGGGGFIDGREYSTSYSSTFTAGSGISASER